MVFSLSERSYFLTFQVVGNLHVSIEVLMQGQFASRGLFEGRQTPDP